MTEFNHIPTTIEGRRFRLKTFNLKLESAIKDEDYEQAVELRNFIKLLEASLVVKYPTLEEFAKKVENITDIKAEILLQTYYKCRNEILLNSIN